MPHVGDELNELSREPESDIQSEPTISDAPSKDFLEKINPFDAPIPGQSLTDTKGASAIESEPSIVDPSEAAEFLADTIWASKATPKILASLARGIPSQVVTRKLLFDLSNKGHFTHDMSLLLGDVAHGMVVAAGLRDGQTDITMNMKDFDQSRFETGTKSEIPSDEEVPVEETKGLLGDL